MVRKTYSIYFAIDRKGILRSTSAREMLEETVDELLKEDTSDT